MSAWCPICEGAGWDWKRAADRDDTSIEDPVDYYWCSTCGGKGTLPVTGEQAQP